MTYPSYYTDLPLIIAPIICTPSITIYRFGMIKDQVSKFQKDLDEERMARET